MPKYYSHPNPINAAAASLGVSALMALCPPPGSRAPAPVTVDPRLAGAVREAAAEIRRLRAEVALLREENAALEEVIRTLARRAPAPAPR